MQVTGPLSLNPVTYQSLEIRHCLQLDYPYSPRIALCLELGQISHHDIQEMNRIHCRMVSHTTELYTISQYHIIHSHPMELFKHSAFGRLT